MSDEHQGPVESEGTSTPPPAPPQAPPPAPGPAPAQSPPPAAGAGAGPANDTSKLLAAAGYIIWPIALIAILLEPYKDEPFVKFHAVQALGLAVAGIIVSVGGGIIAVIPVIGWIAATVAGLAVFVFAIIGAIKAFSGEYYEMPIVHGLVKQYI